MRLLHTSNFVDLLLRLCVVLLHDRLPSLALAGSYQHVASCPITAAQWKQRSSTKCGGSSTLFYHCMLDFFYRPIETCIIPQTVPGNDVGCPWIEIYEDNKPYLGHPFTDCPVQNRFCPPRNHATYKTNELFKYTACFENVTNRNINFLNESTTTGNGKYVTTMDGKELREIFIITLIILSIVIIASSGILIIKLRRYCLCLRNYRNQGRGCSGCVNFVRSISEYVETREKEKMTILHDACRREDFRLVTYLVEYFPDLLKSRDVYGRTPLHAAAMTGSVPIVELLLTKTAKLNAFDVDNEGNTIFHYAYRYSRVKLKDYLKSKFPQVTDDYMKRCTSPLASDLSEGSNERSESKNLTEDSEQLFKKY